MPLFALPSYVLFPHTLVPFHVFERCYLQLIDASLAGDRLLVVSGIPTMDDGGYGTPFRVAGLGRVVSDRRYRDGRIDIFVHGPHHRHPRVAHTSLGELMDDYVEANPKRDLPVYPTYARATLAMLPWLIRNPGVGVNVGAAEPSNIDDVKDFLQDVSREVLTPDEVGIQ